uniref:DNA-directed DNA polymerase n=1 Tax=Trichogramma kaykai TaxID=54128 RepID=A0ABD2WZ65_9HYME
MGLAQSNTSFYADEPFNLNATFIDVPHGYGRKRLPVNINTVSKRSIVAINNDDDLCLARALIVGEAYLAYRSDITADARREWDRARDGRYRYQHELAMRLMRDAGVTIDGRGGGYAEIRQFQAHYDWKKISIVAFDRITYGQGSEPFFDGRKQSNDKVIYLLYDDRKKHFDTIINPVGVVKDQYFCTFCNVRYRCINTHVCEKICDACFQQGKCDSSVEKIKCEKCYRTFYGVNCLTKHASKAKGSKYALCDVVKICQKCFAVTNTLRDSHECGLHYCAHCKTKHSPNELCFMQPIKEAERNNSKYLYIFFDFETRQDSAYKNHSTTTVHIPTLCIAHQVCSDCIQDDDMKNMCVTCGIREYVFQNDPVAQLLGIAIREKTKFKKIVCLSHNGSSYDTQLVIQRLVERSNSNRPPNAILNGHNIILLQYGRTIFIDSLNYFHMKLSALPRAFGLPESKKKGYFPHFFNTLENKEYVGPMPAASFYGLDAMSTSEREKFLAWYETARTQIFDIRKEEIDYCKMDVEILRRACLEFRKIMINLAEVDPFAQATTIASACSYMFRKKFLKENTIALIPPAGYRRCDTHSQIAIEWLLLCEHEVGCEIIHAGRSREHCLMEGYRVDGYLGPTDGSPRGTVFEFQGCFYHGCLKCYPSGRDRVMFNNRTLNESYERTKVKIERLKALGYTVRSIWECDFEQIKQNVAGVSEIIDKHPLISKIKIDPRDSFFGGRTENFVTHYDVKQGEKIRYIDVCSLYPYVCKYGKYPRGHPTIYVGEECDQLTGGDANNLSNVEGLVKCKILPPRDLYIPVIPVKMNSRLMFSLCRSCCAESIKTDCPHEDVEDRAFVGTWVADELRKALQKGYKILNLYVVWQYEIIQYDKSKNSTGLFTEYIDTFLKFKQEASGWPAWCESENDKIRYISEYKASENISLEPDKIKKNPALRQFSKLALNSFWGKFSQRTTLSQTSIIKNRQDLLELLTSPDKETHDIVLVSDETIYAQWKYKEEAENATCYTNVVLAAYTTAQARIVLYEYLEKLDRRVLYCDTDSVVYTSAVGEYEPPLGTSLGAMTDELEPYGKNTYIRSFVSGGPKFYAYEAYTQGTGELHHCCKIKGISLNHENSKKINYDSVKRMILRLYDDEDDCNDNSVTVNFRAIRRTKTHDIVSRDESKRCCPVLKKRRFIGSEFSLPFGFVQ